MPRSFQDWVTGRGAPVPTRRSFAEFNAARTTVPAVEAESAEEYSGAGMFGIGTRGKAQAFERGAEQGVSFGTSDEIRGGVAKLTGGSYGETVEKERGHLQNLQEQHPLAYAGGEATGIGATLALPGVNVMRGATLVPRAVNAAATGAAYGAAYGAGTAEGGPTERIRGALPSAALGATVGGAAPPVLRAIAVGGKAIAAPFRMGRGLVNPEREAARRVVRAVERDAGTPEAGVRALQSAQQTHGRAPMIAADLGETTRAVGRSAANTSPEGRAVLGQTMERRGDAQKDRVLDVIRRYQPGANATATREQLETQARRANRGNYARAYQEGSGGLWSPELERLTSSPAVVAAMRNAAQRGQDRAVTEGFGGFNPGVSVGPGGQVSFMRGKTGVPTYPNLQYWDYVKRELDDAANAARRSGRNEEAATVGGLAGQLRSELDNLVPAFAQARAGAAGFFGAGDALEAGAKFVDDSGRFRNAEARQAIAKMAPAEKTLFAEGFADALMQRLREVGDRRSVVNQIFLTSPAAKERIEIALGPKAAKALEVQLRVENIMDMTRRALQGNSTTARQLVEAGLAGGAVGAYQGGGDITSISAGAIIGAALRRGATKIDERIARRVAERLASDDPQVLQEAIDMIGRSPQLLNALRSAEDQLGRVVIPSGVSRELSGSAPVAAGDDQRQ